MQTLKWSQSFCVCVILHHQHYLLMLIITPTLRLAAQEDLARKSSTLPTQTCTVLSWWLRADWALLAAC